MKILVMSCDKNYDLWEPFYHCMEKYWSDHPEIIYSTETRINPYYKTVCKNYPLCRWTDRVRETAEELDDDYIFAMCDDIFIRKSFDIRIIDSLLDVLIKENGAAINFEKSFDKKDIKYNDLVSLMSPTSSYKTSMMFQLWNRACFVDVLSGISADPWKFEDMNNHKNYKYFRLNDFIIDWGHKSRGDRWAVYRGKWMRESVEFFNKEGVLIDYDKRGFCD